MQYRPEIDGLRAVAVLPVILFHAGFSVFHGGFVGVDVFFVISGYLITTILLDETRQQRFSLLTFYERRARRILPALFVVMAVCCVLAYLWMLPDELENFGQSVLATSAFANNMLLMMTAGYWSLASEFKPLLHTWSLGVEEQFYIAFPLLLMLCRRWQPRQLAVLLLVLVACSLAAAEWLSVHKPNSAFYLLPTRAWELLLGSLAALHLAGRSAPVGSATQQQWGSLAGLLLIVGAVFGFDSGTRSPSLAIVAPTLGAVLIILYARQGTWVHSLLASPWPVQVGLMSYSAYLWHQPLFAFARIYSANKPELGVMALLCVLTLVLAYATWRFVEAPFRQKGRFGRGFIFAFSVLLSLGFAGWGYLLHARHGLPQRTATLQAPDDGEHYIEYNERVHQYSKDSFSLPGALKVLVVGNSYARDFVNMNLETFDLKSVEFIYRKDLGNCIEPAANPVVGRLYQQADIVVFGSGGAILQCLDANIAKAKADGKRIFYAGGKNFGYNLNWLVRLSPQQRANQTNAMLDVAVAEEATLRAAVPPEHFISLLDKVLVQGRMPVTNNQGWLLSQDRGHVTRTGARYMGQRALPGTLYAQALGAHAVPRPPAP